MTIVQIMEVQRNNIENIIYSSGGLSPHEKCVVLYDMLKLTINELLNQEIELLEKEIDDNDDGMWTGREFADKWLAHLTSLKELIK